MFRRIWHTWLVYLGFREGNEDETGEPLWTPR